MESDTLVFTVAFFNVFMPVSLSRRGQSGFVGCLPCTMAFFLCAVI